VFGQKFSGAQLLPFSVKPGIDATVKVGACHFIRVGMDG
jgi:hypothetical protein